MVRNDKYTTEILVKFAGVARAMISARGQLHVNLPEFDLKLFVYGSKYRHLRTLYNKLSNILIEIFSSINISQDCDNTSYKAECKKHRKMKENFLIGTVGKIPGLYQHLYISRHRTI